jgi:hypothetical protein
MKIKLSSLASLLLFLSGCTIYRYEDYVLQFRNAQTGSFENQKDVKIIFVHEVFPLNAPRDIHTNLDESGEVALRLPDPAEGVWWARKRAN